MNLGIVMPVWLQEPAVLEMTLRNVGRLDRGRLYVVPTRLRGVSAGELLGQLTMASPVPVTLLYEPCVERSVAGAWNHGIRHALADGCDRLLILANDVTLLPGCLDKLEEHGNRWQSGYIWSGTDSKHPASDEVSGGCDFSCVMMRAVALERFGWFDERYKPAYFEDNDYFARVCLGGSSCAQLGSARFDHEGSATIRKDPEAAHHVRHWFEKNRARYAAKWGPQKPPNDKAGVLAQCYKTPWDDPTLTVKDWDRE